MKSKIFIFAALVLGLVFSMTFINCEKTLDVSPEYTMDESLVIPTETTPYVTSEKLENLYHEVQAMSVDIRGWKVIPLSITMRSTVKYEYAGKNDYKTPTAIIFNGTGKWRDMGEVDYYEKVSLLPTKIADSKGEGIIALMKPYDTAIASRDNELEFISDQRMVKGVVDRPGNGIMPAPSEIIESVINITEGTGIFGDAYGKAYKTELYFGDKNYCELHIQGYVWVRNTFIGVNPPPVDM